VRFKVLTALSMKMTVFWDVEVDWWICTAVSGEYIYKSIQ